jgi:hypothetical protein
MTATAIDAYTGESGSDAERESRLFRVLSRAGRLRSIGGEQWLFAAGAGLVVAGLLCILVGWVGTSRTVLVAGQIPYLVSGGLLGLGLVFIGGFVYFGHWVAVMARENRDSAAADRRDMAALRDSIAGLTLAMRDAAASSRGSAPLPTSRGAHDSAPIPLVATPSGSMMHRPECPAVAGRNGVRHVSRTEGLRACGICRPLADRSPL